MPPKETASNPLANGICLCICVNLSGFRGQILEECKEKMQEFCLVSCRKQLAWHEHGPGRCNLFHIVLFSLRLLDLLPTEVATEGGLRFRKCSGT